MTQIKLSIAFVLAAAAIVPIVAQPMREGNKFASNAVDLPHHHHHHSHPHHQGHHHKHVEQSPLEQTSDATPPPSPREFVDEFEARGLLNSAEKNVKALGRQDAQLEHTHKTLEAQNGNLQHTDKHLKNVEGHLKQKDQSLQREGGKLKHVNQSLKGQNKFLSGRKDRLLNEDNKLGRKRTTLARKDKVLGGEHRYLLHKNKALGRKDKVLGHEGKAVEHHIGVLKREGHALAHKNKAPAHKAIVAREYADPDEMFERAESEDSAAASPGPVVRPNSKLAIHHPLRGFAPGRAGLRFGHGIPLRRPFGGFIGTPQRPRFGFGLVNRRGPALRGIGPREYVDSDDMFERDLEDLEFDAREFEDDLYLD